MFEQLIGKKIKVLYKEGDNEPEPRMFKGVLIGIENNFLRIQRFSNQIIFVNLANVVFVKEIYDVPAPVTRKKYTGGIRNNENIRV